jgi:2-polyprenyl-3-methyl-5-hydroxy-6-metoxy-1,4-benzoquinol methylase
MFDDSPVDVEKLMKRVREHAEKMKSLPNFVPLSDSEFDSALHDERSSNISDLIVPTNIGSNRKLIGPLIKKFHKLADTEVHWLVDPTIMKVAGELQAQLDYLSTTRLEMIRNEFYLALDYALQRSDRANTRTNRRILFEKYARTFPGLSGVFKGSDPYSKAQRARRKEIIKRSIGDSVLEIGCADGGIISSLANLGLHAVGVDLATPFLYSAQKPAEYICADGFSLPLADKSFDTVILAEILEHIDNPLKVLLEAVRVCRERIVITVPTDLNDPTHISQFDKARMSEMIGAVPGVASVSIDEISHFLIVSLDLER